jgi:hypothetical protein
MRMSLVGTTSPFPRLPAALCLVSRALPLKRFVDATDLREALATPNFAPRSGSEAVFPLRPFGGVASV